MQGFSLSSWTRAWDSTLQTTTDWIGRAGKVVEDRAGKVMEDIVVITDTVDEFISAIALPPHEADHGHPTASSRDENANSRGQAGGQARGMAVGGVSALLPEDASGAADEQWGDFSMDDEQVRQACEAIDAHAEERCASAVCCSMDRLGLKRSSWTATLYLSISHAG